MKLLLIALLINLIYFASWFAYYKLRCSHKEHIRLYDNDYEFYESLSKEDKEIYWQADTKLINQCLLRIILAIDVILIIYQFTLYIKVTLFLSLILILIIFIQYIKDNLKFKKHFNHHN